MLVLHIKLTFPHHSCTASSKSPALLHDLSKAPLFSRLFRIWHLVYQASSTLSLLHSIVCLPSVLGDHTFRNPSYHSLIGNKSIIRCDYLFWLSFDCLQSLVAVGERRQLSACSCFHIFILSLLEVFAEAAVTSLSTFAHLHLIIPSSKTSSSLQSPSNPLASMYTHYSRHPYTPVLRYQTPTLSSLLSRFPGFCIFLLRFNQIDSSHVPRFLWLFWDTWTPHLLSKSFSYNLQEFEKCLCPLMNRGINLAFISFFVQRHLSVIHTLQSWWVCAGELWCSDAHRAVIQAQLATQPTETAVGLRGQRGKTLALL